MLIEQLKRKLHSARFRSGLAFVMLLFALADVNNPTQCCSCSSADRAGEAWVDSCTLPATATVTVDEPTDPGHHAPASDCEDCFCCGRFVTSPVIGFEAADLESSVTNLRPSWFPSSPPQSLFHPPRLA